MSPASKARLAKVSAAMSRITGENRWHVFPAEGRWVVLRDQAQRATRVLPSRSEAVKLARTLAEDAGGEVIIHRQDGTLQERQVADRASGRLETVYTHSGSPD